MQALGLVAVGAFTFSVSYGSLWTMNRLWGIRVEQHVETAGLDVAEHGMWGYPEFYIPVPGGYGTESHGHLGIAHAHGSPRRCRSRALLRPPRRGIGSPHAVVSRPTPFPRDAIVLLLVPGPAVLYVVTRSIEMGPQGGIASVAGITTGTVAYVVLATAGLSSLILASSVAFDAVRYVGAAYLFVLGVRRLFGRGLDPDAEHGCRERAGARMPRVSREPRIRRRSSSSLPSCRSSSTRGADAGLQVLALGLSFAVLGFLSDSMYAVAAGTIADRLRGSEGHRAAQRRFGGSVLVGLGPSRRTGRRVDANAMRYLRDSARGLASCVRST